MHKEYELRYLPLFEQDMMSVRDYIAYTLKNPAAALRLIEDTENAIQKRLENPLAFEPYQSGRDHEHAYYRIGIRNYFVFYVVIGNIMEVRRFLYSKRNIPDIV